MHKGRTPFEFDALFVFALPLPFAFAKFVDETTIRDSPRTLYNVLEFAVSLVVRLAPALEQGNLILHRVTQRHVLCQVNRQDMRRKVYLLIQLIADGNRSILMLAPEFRVRRLSSASAKAVG